MSNDGELPDGWTTAALSELVADDGIFCDGDWVETKDQDPNGDVRLTQLADIGDGAFLNKSRRYLTAESAERLGCTFLEANDVLIARMPDPLGRACIFPGDDLPCVTAVDIAIVRPGTSEISPRWLMWFVNSPEFRANVAALQSGSTRKRISRRNLATIQLPVPPPAEQRRIADRIEELFSILDSGVASAQRVLTNLQRYRAAVLKAAVAGELTSEWRAEHPETEPASELLERILEDRREAWEQEQLEKYAEKGKEPPKNWKNRYKEPEPPDVHGLPELSEGWAWATVQQLADVQGGIQKQPNRAPKSNAYPYLRVANVRRGHLDLDQIEYMELFGDEIDRLRLRPGDLLVVEGNGSRDQIGRSAVWLGEIDDCVHQNHIIRVRPMGVSSRYLDYYWNSPEGMMRAIEVSASTSGLYTLSVTKVNALPVPVPPLDEQTEVVAEVERRLSVIDEIEKEVDGGLKRAERLRQAILKKAFEGRLVPQDRDDEPASVMPGKTRTAGA